MLTASHLSPQRPLPSSSTSACPQLLQVSGEESSCIISRDSFQTIQVNICCGGTSVQRSVEKASGGHLDLSQGCRPRWLSLQGVEVLGTSEENRDHNLWLWGGGKCSLSRV